MLGPAEYQSRKFFFLKGKNKKGKARAKNEWKNFLLCPPQGERRRGVGLSPFGRQSKVGVGMLVKIDSNFVQKTALFYDSRPSHCFLPRPQKH